MQISEDPDESSDAAVENMFARRAAEQESEDLVVLPSSPQNGSQLLLCFLQIQAFQIHGGVDSFCILIQ